MYTTENFRADIDNIDALGTMIQLKPAKTFEGGTLLLKQKTFGPPMHSHPSQSELIRVIQGELQVFNGKKWVLVQEGEQIYIPKKTTHSYRNTTNEVVVFDFALTPKVGLINLLLTVDELVKSEKINSKLPFRSMIYKMQAMASFPQVSSISWPPQFLVSLFASVTKIFGYDISREKYRATYLRPVAIWKAPKQSVDIDSSKLEDILF